MSRHHGEPLQSPPHQHVRHLPLLLGPHTEGVVAPAPHHLVAKLVNADAPVPNDETLDTVPPIAHAELVEIAPHAAEIFVAKVFAQSISESEFITDTIPTFVYAHAPVSNAVKVIDAIRTRADDKFTILKFTIVLIATVHVLHFDDAFNLIADCKLVTIGAERKLIAARFTLNPNITIPLLTVEIICIVYIANTIRVEFCFNNDTIGSCLFEPEFFITNIMVFVDGVVVGGVSMQVVWLELVLWEVEGVRVGDGVVHGGPEAVQRGVRGQAVEDDTPAAPQSPPRQPDEAGGGVAQRCEVIPGRRNN